MGELWFAYTLIGVAGFGSIIALVTLCIVVIRRADAPGGEDDVPLRVAPCARHDGVLLSEDVAADPVLVRPCDDFEVKS